MCPEATPLQWSDRLVQRFWNYQSRFPDKYFTSLYGQQIVEAFREFIPKQARVLDYACGTGALTKHLLSFEFFVGACDLALDSVEYVKSHCSQYSTFLGASTVNDLSSEDQQFDVVALVEIVEHVSEEVFAKIMADSRKLLVKDGVVIITTPNDEDLDAETVYCPCCDHTFHRWQHVCSWSEGSLAKSLSNHGFEVVSVQKTDFSLTKQDGLVRYYLNRLYNFASQRKQPHLMVVAKVTPLRDV